MTTNPAPQRHKVLIVDDDPGMVHLLARTLLDMAQLHFAVRGDDALAKLAQHKPDLLVIDAELPDLDGYSVIARLRETLASRSLTGFQAGASMFCESSCSEEVKCCRNSRDCSRNSRSFIKSARKLVADSWSASHCSKICCSFFLMSCATPDACAIVTPF